GLEAGPGLRRRPERRGNRARRAGRSHASRRPARPRGVRLRMTAASLKGRPWRKRPAIANPYLRWAAIIAACAYLVAAGSTLDVDWARVARGLDRARNMFAGFMQPDFTARWSAIRTGILESLTMTVVATALGVVLSRSEEHTSE